MGSKCCSEGMRRLTKYQVMRGDREAMMGDDQAGITLQQFVCMCIIKVLIAQMGKHGYSCEDSESTKSRVGCCDKTIMITFFHYHITKKKTKNIEDDLNMTHTSCATHTT